MRAEYYAHSLKDRPVTAWERLEDHLAAVAKRAKTFAAKFGAADWGEVAGLWHDLGKHQEAVQLIVVGNGDSPQTGGYLHVD
jgi:CRISPR-associated endonuclease/helicase Cas3